MENISGKAHLKKTNYFEGSLSQWSIFSHFHENVTNETIPRAEIILMAN